MKQVYLRNKNGDYLSLIDRKTVVAHKAPYALQTLPEEGVPEAGEAAQPKHELLHLPGSYLIFKGDGAGICRAIYDAEGNNAHITVVVQTGDETVTGQLSFTTRTDKYGLQNQFEVMCYWVADLSAQQSQ